MQLLILLNHLGFENVDDKIVYVRKHNQSSRHSNFENTVQLTTVYYPDQISSYRTFDKTTFVSTTPTNFNFNRSEYVVPADTDDYYEVDESFSNTNEDIKTLSLRSDEEYFDPPNHRKRYISKIDEHPSEVLSEPDPFDFFVNTETPSGFKTSHSIGGTKIRFPDSQLIDTSSSTVNNIRDILDQANDDQSSNDMAYAPSIPRARGIRIEGTYRRLKAHDIMDEDSLAPLSSTQSIQRVPVYHMSNNNAKAVKDVFSRFKPASPSDVNTLASSHYFRPSYYRHNRPRPITEPQVMDHNLLYKNYGVDFNDPESLYNQIIMANNNRLKFTAKNSRTEKSHKSHKPFSLMLDVYPMADDEPSPKKPQLLSAKRPLMPINVNAINHNIPYVHDHSYYNHMKFPQLQNYRMPDYHNYYNSLYFRNFLTNRQSSLMNPVAITSAPQVNTAPVNENNPSQITVHLNLFPNKKIARKQKNVEILNNRNGMIDDDFHDRRTHEIHVPENRVDLKNITFNQNEPRGRFDISQWVQDHQTSNYSNATRINLSESNQRNRVLGDTDANSSSSDLQFSKYTPRNITFPVSNRNANTAHQAPETIKIPLQSTASTFVYSSPLM